MRDHVSREFPDDRLLNPAMLAARNILGEDHDVWTVNVERSYHEEFQLNESKKGVNNKGRAVARQISS